jgi:Zn-dependent M28 family amino/carboxypeptidase
MHKPNRLISVKSLIFCLFAVSASANPLFRGTVALADTRHAVSFGERPSGSQANVRLREWIVAELKRSGAQVAIDDFSGRTPDGPVAMANVIAKFPGSSGKAIAVTGHFDSKKIAGVHFLGANDAGSSTGFLLEFARAMTKWKHRDDIVLVFFDGEEALGDWSDKDSCYGSRHLAAKWLADGTLSHLIALINVDMIGDKDLDILNDASSSATLRDMTWKAAANLGYGKYFHKDLGGIDDDHRPFTEVGVNAMDLIDFAYGQHQAYWHTALDTMDKLSAQSLQIVGDVVLEVVKELDQQN